MPKKLRVGIFSFTGDEGCAIVFLGLLNVNFFKWKKLIDFRYCRVLKSKNDIENLDVAFVEGAISTESEEKRLKEIRKNCKRLVAIGSCAMTGAPSNYRNSFDEEKLKEIEPILKKFGLRKKISPLNEIIKVDDNVPGCPMMEDKFLEVLNGYLKEFGVLEE